MPFFERRMRLLFHTAVVALSISVTRTAADQPRQSSEARRLLLDDEDLAEVRNLRRTMHAPVKKGAVIRPQHAWEGNLQTRSAPVWDPQEKKFKLWLITSTPYPEMPGGTTYVQSKDGIQWERPPLRQVDLRGSRENNFLTWESAKTWPANALENVVVDLGDPDSARRFKGLAHCDGREPVVSADGIHWKRLPVAKLPSQDESNLTFDRRSRRFLATLKQTGPHGRAVMLSTSKDFERWTKPDLLFHADDEDQQHSRTVIAARKANAALQQARYDNPADYGADIYNMPIFEYEGVYIGLPAVFYHTGKGPDRNYDGFHHVQLISSRDLKGWHRHGERNAFIGPSPVSPESFDNTQILPPSCPIVHGKELWFCYTGTRYRYAPPDTVESGAVCLAVLRRDGFVSLDAGATTGSLLTKPRILPQGNLHLNIDAGQGSVVVEVCDEKGTSLAELPASAPIQGDHLDVTVWPSDKLKAINGKQVSLRITLRQASIYSYWYE